MKKFLFIVSVTLLSLHISFISYSQNESNPEGSWYGLLNIQGVELKLVFHLLKDGNLYTALMDSPDQHAYGIPVTSITFENSILRIAVSNAMIEYVGVYTGNRFMGTFKQGGASYPLNLSRRAFDIPKRPQEPLKPYPYTEEDIFFVNYDDSIVLAGTLALPKSNSIQTAVVLISGSGPQNRDCEIMGHKPFLVISDYLVRRGIAVLRYDDRGIGYSGGKQANSTTKDFASDVVYSLKYLRSRRELTSARIGMIGHSEGGVIAPIVASNENLADFMVLLASPAMKGYEVILKQQSLIAAGSGVSEKELLEYEKTSQELFDLVGKNRENPHLLDLVVEFMKQNAPNEIESTIRSQAKAIVNPWMLDFLFYDPIPALNKSYIPALALNGENDLQVPVSNLKLIEESYGRKDIITVMGIPGVNHLFQTSLTGLPQEYSTIEETFAEKVLEIIYEWVSAH